MVCHSPRERYGTTVAPLDVMETIDRIIQSPSDLLDRCLDNKTNRRRQYDKHEMYIVSVSSWILAHFAEVHIHVNKHKFIARYSFMCTCLFEKPLIEPQSSNKFHIELQIRLAMVYLAWRVLIMGVGWATLILIVMWTILLCFAIVKIVIAIV